MPESRVKKLWGILRGVSRKSQDTKRAQISGGVWKSEMGEGFQNHCSPLFWCCKSLREKSSWWDEHPETSQCQFKMGLNLDFCFRLLFVQFPPKPLLAHQGVKPCKGGTELTKTVFLPVGVFLYFFWGGGQMFTLKFDNLCAAGFTSVLLRGFTSLGCGLG